MRVFSIYIASTTASPRKNEERNFNMGKSWFPLKDADLLLFAQNWVTRGATPSNYNWVAGDVTSLSTITTGFDSALTLATDPTTRTRVTIDAKDVQKGTLIAQLR